MTRAVLARLVAGLATCAACVAAAPDEPPPRAPADAAVMVPPPPPLPPDDPPAPRADWRVLAEDAGETFVVVDATSPRDVAPPRVDAAPPAVDAPPSTEPCGRYAGWTVWSCIDARVRVRCVGAVLQRDTCATRCVVQPVGYDDYCASTAAPPPDDRCSWATSCGTCTPQSNCGFCRSLGRCYVGTGYGPVNRACPYADWVWYPRDCGGATPTPPTDGCASSATCGTCTPRSGCGFCRATGRCQTGNAVGPATGDCAAGQWAWNPEDCGGTPSPPPAPSPPPPPAVDAGPPPAGCIAVAPTSGFCASPGACNLAAPDTIACETRAPYAFYGPEYCNARATVVVVGAGWCGACQMEAPLVESQVTRPYASSGVRVVTLLTENSDRSPATVDFGLRWQTRYGLTSRMVVDPGNTISRRVRLSAYPFVVVIDRAGRLRMAEAAPRISRVRAVLDAILAER